MTRDLHQQLQDTLGIVYSVERELGGGGMSRVFLATDTVLHRHVVVKVLPPDLAAEVSLERFRREIQLAARLQHPHIVPLLSASESSDLLYFTMPFVEGESLRQRLARTGELPVSEAVRILRDVTLALAYAHGRGVIHRDLKPENILLSSGSAMVTDFGVAKALSLSTGVGRGALTSAGMALGTPTYMAPEQAAAEPTMDHRADLYALGVVAYELLSGEPPFAGRPLHAVVAANMTEIPELLSRRRRGVPVALTALVMHLLEKRPADRPQAAEEVLHLLEAAGTPSGPMSAGAESDTTADGPPPTLSGVVSRSTRPAEIALAGRPTPITTRPWHIVTLATVIALVAVASFATYRRLGAGARVAAGGDTTANSVAVLPFVNMSLGQENEYFSDGMTEELINALSKVPGLRVPARTSAFAFKGRNEDIGAIGRQLKVANVLEGSVRRAGSKLRVTAQLIDARTGYHLWSEVYDRELRDVFAVQDEIARAIVGKLRVTLAGLAGAPLVRQPTADVEAYTLYLQGRYFCNQRVGSAIDKSIIYFRRAIERDSGFALAYAAEAVCDGLSGAFGRVTPSVAFGRAKLAAARALALDSSLAEAQTALAFIHVFNEWNWPAAEREFERAFALDSNYADARLYHAWYYIALGRTRDALAEIEHAHRLEPLSLIISTRLGTMLYFARRYDEAVRQIRATLELDSTYTLARAQLGAAYTQQGRYPDAIAQLKRVPAVFERYEGGGALGYTLAAAGKRGEAFQLLDSLKRRSTDQRVDPITLALTFTGLGDKDSAFTYLERAIEQRSWSVVTLRAEPMFDRLRSDSRFSALLRKSGMSQR